MSYKNEKSVILAVLKANKGRVMTVVDIINYAHKYGLTEDINAPREAHSHPFWKACSSLKEDNIANVFVGKAVGVSATGKIRKMFAYTYI